MSTLELKELSHPAGEVIKIAAGKTLDLKTQGSVTMPSGSVLQVVNGITNTVVETSSTTYVDTGLTATITPTSTSNKILVTVTQLLFIGNTARSNGVGVKLLRGSTVILDNDNGLGYGSVYRDINVASITNMGFTSVVTFSYIDSPSTTSATTYKITGRLQSANNGGSVRFQGYSGHSTITLTEVSA